MMDGKQRTLHDRPMMYDMVNQGSKNIGHLSFGRGSFLFSSIYFYEINEGAILHTIGKYCPEKESSTCLTCAANP